MNLYPHQERVLASAARWVRDMTPPPQDPGAEDDVEDLVAALARSPFLASSDDRAAVRAALDGGEGILADIARALAQRMCRPRVTTNTILLDMPVGSGKTRTAFAITEALSEAPVQREFEIYADVRRCSFSPGDPGPRVTRQVLRAADDGAGSVGHPPRFLVIVPSNAIAKQWVAEGARVGLGVFWVRGRADWDDDARYFVIRNAPSGSLLGALRATCESRHVIWDAVVIDECHEYTRTTIPAAKRYVLLSASATQRVVGTGRTVFAPWSRLTRLAVSNFNGVADIRIRCTEEEVRQSIQLPPMEVLRVPVVMEQLAGIVFGEVPAEAMIAIDAGMHARALELMGLAETHASVDEVVEALLRKSRAAIALLTPVHASMADAGMDVTDVAAEIAALERRVAGIEARVRAASGGEACPICMRDAEDSAERVVLGCSHSMCAACTLELLQRGALGTCPVCRDPVRSMHQLGGLETPSATETRRAALARIVREIAATPDRRAVIFCPFANGVVTAGGWLRIVRAAAGGCEAFVAAGGLREIEGFRAGRTRFLVTCPSHMASGVDLSCATDMILLGGTPTHTTATIKQMVGRCQRPPRTASLRLHAILHLGEDLAL